MTPGKVGTLGVSKNNDTPKIIHFNRVFHHKPSILGYLYLSATPMLGTVKKNGENGDVLLVVSIAEVRKISSAKAILGASHVLRFNKMCKKTLKS